MAGTDIYQAEPDHKWTGDATIHPLKKNVMVLRIITQRYRDAGMGDMEPEQQQIFGAIADIIGKELPYQCISQYIHIHVML